MNDSDRTRYRDMLLALRAEMVGDANKLRRESSSAQDALPSHMADAASDTYDRDFSLERLSVSTETVQDIDDALDRIEAGAFGVCEECGGTIGEKRLQVKPWAALCIECQRREEAS